MKRFFSQPAKLAALSAHRRRLLLRAVPTLFIVKVKLCLVSFGNLYRAVERRCQTLDRAWNASPCARPPADDIAWAVVAAYQVVPGGNNCLARALAAKLMLARFGYRSELRVGALKNETEAFAAHAWLEAEGRIIVGGAEAGDFTVFGGLDKAASAEQHAGE